MSFVSESERPGVIVRTSELTLANNLSKQLDLFAIASTPRAYEQVQSQFQMFKYAEPPFKRLGHKRNHRLAGLKRAQKPSSGRFSRDIDFQTCLFNRSRGLSSVPHSCRALSFRYSDLQATGYHPR